MTKVAHNTEANTLSAVCCCCCCVGLDHQSHFSFHFLTIKANENTADLGRALFLSVGICPADGALMLLISRSLPSKHRNDGFELAGGKKMMRGAKGNEFAVSSCTGKYTRCVYLSAILGDIASPVGCGPLSPSQRRLMDMRLKWI